MKILVIAAMPEELEAMNTFLPDHTMDDHMGIEHYNWKNEHIDVLTVRSGIGKVNSAVSTSLLIQHFNPDYVINTGSAGGLTASTTIGDVIIGDTLTYHDTNVTAFGYKPGQVPRMPEAYYSSHDLIQHFAHQPFDFNLHVGHIVSGDSFLACADTKKNILTTFPTALAIDMESCSIAQTCYVLNKPCIIIRSISDNANNESNMTFKEFLPIAAQNSATLVHHLIKKLVESKKHKETL